MKLTMPSSFLRSYHLVVPVTCNMVSKLKVSPFHKVNSPLEAPVTNRLPSGVHWGRKRKTG